MAVWTVTYNNDTGPNDEGYFEWWDISDGNVTFQANDQHSAQWLCDQLNLQKEEAAAENMRLRAALEELLACPHVADRDIDPAWIEPETEAAVEAARAALEGK